MMPTRGTKQTRCSAVSQANAVWGPEKMLMKMRFFSLPCPGCKPLPSPLWRSWAYSFLVRLIGMNGPTCAAFRARARLQWGSCPLGHPAGHSRGDWWPRLLKCVWGSSSWSCPALCWSSPLTGRASAEASNWTVKTHRAVWYITVDTDRPRDRHPPPSSPHLSFSF